MGIFAGFGVLLLVASPFLLLAAPCILCCKCKLCKCCEEEDDVIDVVTAWWCNILTETKEKDLKVALVGCAIQHIYSPQVNGYFVREFSGLKIPGKISDFLMKFNTHLPLKKLCFFVFSSALDIQCRLYLLVDICLKTL